MNCPICESILKEDEDEQFYCPSDDSDYYIAQFNEGDLVIEEYAYKGYDIYATLYTTKVYYDFFSKIIDLGPMPFILYSSKEDILKLFNKLNKLTAFI